MVSFSVLTINPKLIVAACLYIPVNLQIITAEDACGMGLIANVPTFPATSGKSRKRAGLSIICSHWLCQLNALLISQHPQSNRKHYVRDM